jgi:lysyl-tRNA synthetase class 2
LTVFEANACLDDPVTASAGCRHAVLALRSRVLQAVRQFFVERGFIEVETPVRVKTPALELHIDAEPSGDHYLRTSPELHMKRLLAEGEGRIFQMGPCFRCDEKGRLHYPEYTMLEWYRSDSDYLDVLVDAKGLLNAVVEAARPGSGGTFPYQGSVVDVSPVWDCLSVRDVFRAYAGWDPFAGFDAERFDEDMVLKVEPALSRERPVVLKDYPVEAAALATCTGDPPHAERWELYLAGVELANAYSELTDPVEQRARFEACATARKAWGRAVYPIDEAFLAALEVGLPPCAGVALGIDRLVMLLCGATAIDAVTAFQD